MCKLLGFAVLIAASIAARAGEHWPAASYDTRGWSQARVDALKREVRAGFWLETGDALLVASDDATQTRLGKSAKRVAEHGQLALDELVLAPIGCDEGHMHVTPRPLAVIGHDALLALPAPVAKRWEDGRAVVANSVLAREFRAPAGKAGVDPQLLAIADSVDTARWFGRVQALATHDRLTYGTTIDGARDWLVAQFQAMGLAVTTQDFTINNGFGVFTRQNVIATLPGRTQAGSWVIVGGHYDSRNIQNAPAGNLHSPGAEDNGTGCAGVLELADVMRQFPPDRTIKFICYAGEEQGLYGSNSHVISLANNGDLERVRLVVIMDMIGFSEDDDLDLLLESSTENSALLSEAALVATQYAPGSRAVLSTAPCCSDHIGYLARNLPTYLAIENDWSSYPYYHDDDDLPANITNAQAMGGKILRTNAVMVARYAGARERWFDDSFE